MNDIREIAEKIVARGASINPLYVCGEIVSVPELAAAYLDLLKRTESHVLRSTEPLGATYEEIRKARCEWCEKGVPFDGDGRDGGTHYFKDAPRPGYFQDCFKPCTAPTPEQVIEEQGREIERITKADSSARELCGGMCRDYERTCADLRGQLQTAEQELAQTAARANAEAQLACDLRSSQDVIIERCAKAVDEWPEAAARLRNHCGRPEDSEVAVSGEDFGELRRALQASQQETERLRTALTRVLSWSKPQMEEWLSREAFRSAMKDWTEAQGLLSAPSAPQGEQPDYPSREELIGIGKGLRDVELGLTKPLSQIRAELAAMPAVEHPDTERQ